MRITFRTGLAFAAGIALNMALLYSDLSAWLRLGAPFVPTAQTKIDAIFGVDGLLSMVQNERKHLVDLGSGAGGLVRAAVRQGGFGRATGYEINGALLSYARLRSLLAADGAERDLPGAVGDGQGLGAGRRGAVRARPLVGGELADAAAAL